MQSTFEDAAVFATVWRMYRSSLSTNKKSPTKRLDLRHVTSTTEPTTCAPTECLHVLCRDDLELANTTNGFETIDELWRRFSVAQPYGRLRHLQCSTEEISDLLLWLQQQIQKTIRIRHPSASITIASVQNISPADFERCRTSLQTMIQMCPPDRFLTLITTLYCVAYKLGDLSQAELIVAVSYASCSKVPLSASMYAACELEWYDILSSYEEVFAVSAGTSIEFAYEAMGIFMRQCSIPGLDFGHHVMAKICLRQLRSWGPAIILRPWFGFEQLASEAKSQPFMRYACEHWFTHLRLCSESVDELYVELLAMIREAMLPSPSIPISVFDQRRVLDTGLSLSIIYDLPILGEICLRRGARINTDGSTIPGVVTVSFNTHDFEFVCTFEHYLQSAAEPEFTRFHPLLQKYVNSSHGIGNKLHSTLKMLREGPAENRKSTLGKNVLEDWTEISNEAELLAMSIDIDSKSSDISTDWVNLSKENVMQSS